MSKRKKLSKCHPDRPNHGHGLCQTCYAEDYRQKNPDYVERQRQSARRYQEYNRHELYNKVFKRQYGISKDEVTELSEKQNNVCYICYKHNFSKPLFVDHDHKTKKVRGLLCSTCNFYLAKIDKDKKVLDRLTFYVKNNGYLDIKENK